MRIVLISPHFSEGMGYLENCLPRAMVSLGHEVYVLTSTGQIYFNQPFYRATYEKFLGKPVVEPVRKKIDGYVLQRLPYRLLFGKVVLRGLGRVLKEIHPDVIQTFDPFSFLNVQVIIKRPFLKYKVFTANHIMQSVFPLALAGKREKIFQKIGFYLTRTLPGKFFNLFIERSFPITVDAKAISQKYYSVPLKKMKIIPLGVDTLLFKPPLSDDLKLKRKKFRDNLGVSDEEILCIYTGRFTEGKNPLCLARAIQQLRDSNEKYRALFVGSGPQGEEIASLDGCTVVSFVKFEELANIYLAGDIGVWPREESTSMLDAAASGLPLVISNTVQATERIRDIGFTYNENSVEDMSSVLLKLKDPAVRRRLGDAGVKRMIDNYSWIKMAELRIEEYSMY